jgi:glycosyltransferase involved in cell wall biosynthesis
MPGKLKILSVTRRPHSASFELRVHRLLPYLAEQGLEITCVVIPRRQRERQELVRSFGQYDILWLHRYLIPPWRLASWRRAARRIVFEFDDPILYSTHGLGLSRRLKFAWLLRRCDAAVVANEYLASRTRAYCPDVTVVPMAVDVPPLPQRSGGRGPVQLLWLGGRATMRYLEGLGGVLARLAELRPDIVLRVVGPAALTAGHLAVDYRPWSPPEQDSALRECDIGLCPMPDTRWTRGKSPYKVLQYMASGMAWVGSAVGENIAMAGPPGPEARGLCAGADDEWIDALTSLVDDAALRARLGANGRAYVQQHHSRAHLSATLAEIFRRVAGR